MERHPRFALPVAVIAAGAAPRPRSESGAGGCGVEVQAFQVGQLRGVGQGGGGEGWVGWIQVGRGGVPGCRVGSGIEGRAGGGVG